jgi:hypothetical protein
MRRLKIGVRKEPGGKFAGHEVREESSVTSASERAAFHRNEIPTDAMRVP